MCVGNVYVMTYTAGRGSESTHGSLRSSDDGKLGVAILMGSLKARAALASDFTPPGHQ